MYIFFRTRRTTTKVMDTLTLVMPCRKFPVKEKTLLYNYYPANQLVNFQPIHRICKQSTCFTTWITQGLCNVNPRTIFNAQYNVAIHKSRVYKILELMIYSINIIDLSRFISYPLLWPFILHDRPITIII